MSMRENFTNLKSEVEKVRKHSSEKISSEVKLKNHDQTLFSKSEYKFKIEKPTYHLNILTKLQLSNLY